jgi:hypothetical protein
MFTVKKETCPSVIFNDQLPQADEADYLGLHLDRRLTDLAETHLVKKITIRSKT